MVPPRPSRTLRPSTIVWGVFLLATGALVLAIAAGNRFNVLTLITLALTILGLSALLLAVLPRPKPQVEIEILHPEDLPGTDPAGDQQE